MTNRSPTEITPEETAARIRGRKIGRHGIRLFWCRSLERWVTIPDAAD